MTTPHHHGLLATSRYVPRLRLERSEIYAQHRWMAPGLRGLAKGQRALANWDEDAVTMAVEAARALRSGLEGQTVSALTLASGSMPFAERINAGIVASALGLSADAAVRDVSSSARAATTELIAALSQPGVHAQAQLIVASDRRMARPASTQEMIQGDGAAAVAVGHGPVIATLVGAHTEYADFVDHFRQSGEAYEYGWEERWVREEGYLKIGLGAIRTCLESLQVKASEVAHFVMSATLPKVHEAVAKKLGIAPTAVASTHAETVGDIGCGQPLAMLDTVLRQAQPGALIVVVAFGYGCDVLVLRRTALPCPGEEPQAGKPETSYLKQLSFTGQLELEWGMRAEMDNKTALTAAWRDHGRVAHFEGGRCRECGTVQFPSGRLCINPECNAQDSQDPISLADAPAHVMSHTSDFLAYTPHPPFQFGHIDFDGGGRVLMEFTDTDQDELRPGLPVRMVYRIKEYDPKRGFRRYFWKATPVRAAA
jgi:hydroxymethylglutaryl-CoA synthase